MTTLHTTVEDGFVVARKQLDAVMTARYHIFTITALIIYISSRRSGENQAHSTTCQPPSNA